MGILQFVIIGVGAFLAGGVNALAGGGTLITFPLLTAIGLPAVVANVTNTVALCPGYFGATLAQWKDIISRKRRVWLYLPAAVLGGLLGGVLLLHTGERAFNGIIPYLILSAAILLAVGNPLHKWLESRTAPGQRWQDLSVITFVAVMAASIYGGYFGAGLSVIFLAVLGIMISDSLTRLNALKQVLALATNIAAAIFFVFSGEVNWAAALVMAVFALAGGTVGGRLAGKISADKLRWVVVGIGVFVSIYYFIKYQ